MRAFLLMGGYAAYVWPAFGVFFGVLALDYLTPILRRRRLLRELRGRLARQRSRTVRRERPVSPSPDA